MAADLLALATRALDDNDALAILADALEAEGHPAFDRGPAWTMLIWDPPPPIPQPSDPSELWRFWEKDIRATEHFARAVIAVLLFESWPTSWPLADRAYYDHGFTMSDVTNLEPGDPIRLHVDGSEERTFSAVVVSVDPTKRYVRVRETPEPATYRFRLAEKEST